MAKTWMVKQLLTVTVEGDPMTVPVRGVVEAKTKKEAEAGAEEIAQRDLELVEARLTAQAEMRVAS